MVDRDPVSTHATHDVELVAGWSTGDQDPGERSRALTLIDGCPDCAALAADITAITVAMAALRDGSDSLHRDFRLTAADAERLRRGAGLRRWLRPLAGSSFGFARPVGSFVAALALVGLLASSIPGGLNAGAGAEFVGLSSDDRSSPSAQPASAPEPSLPAAVDVGSASPKAGASENPERTARLAASPSQRIAATASPSLAGGGTTRDVTEGSPPNSLQLASLVLLSVGLALVVGRGLARRLLGPAREP